MAIEAGTSAPLSSKALHGVTIADTVVPEAYVWPAHELKHVAHDAYAHDEIAVIDLQAEDDLHRSVREACANWGFFQVVNHGVPPSLLAKVQAVSKQFFDLPLETKERLECKLQGDRLLGYGFPHSNKLKTSRRPWSEGLFMDIPRVAGFAATLWPQEDDPMRTEFCETMGEYFDAVRELGVRLFRLIVASLGVRDVEVEKFLPKEPAPIRLNHYPPCPDPSRTTGLGPHHDANLITILHQGDVGGLQVLKDGRWVAVRPLPNSFAVNAGNMLQVISNNLCTSALHKAVVNRNEDRYSLAYFVQAPDWDHIAPLPELEDEDHPAKYRPFTWPEYLAIQLEHPTNGLEHFALP